MNESRRFKRKMCEKGEKKVHHFLLLSFFSNLIKKKKKTHREHDPGLPKLLLGGHKRSQDSGSPKRGPRSFSKAPRLQVPVLDQASRIYHCLVALSERIIHQLQPEGRYHSFLFIYKRFNKSEILYRHTCANSGNNFYRKLKILQ